MKRQKTPLAALAFASLLGSASLSQAAVIVSEDFSTNGGLNGQNGGTGFSTSWSSSNGADVSGGVATTPGSDSTGTRSLSTAFASSGTLWVSFDWGYSFKPQEGGSYGGLTFYEGGFGPGTERFLIGNTWPGTGHDVWQMNGSAQTAVTNYGGMKTGVAKITLGAGSTSTIELWVGATGSPVDVSGAAIATSTGIDLAGVDGIRILGYSANGAGQSFDNLLIGTTMTDVDAVPEPSAALLGGLGLLALLRRRRA